MLIYMTPTRFLNFKTQAGKGFQRIKTNDSQRHYCLKNKLKKGLRKRSRMDFA